MIDPALRFNRFPAASDRNQLRAFEANTAISIKPNIKPKSVSRLANTISLGLSAEISIIWESIHIMQKADVSIRRFKASNRPRLNQNLAAINYRCEDSVASRRAGAFATLSAEGLH